MRRSSPPDRARAARRRIRSVFGGTRQVAFAFDSTVTNSTHAYATVDEFVREVRDARIVGGMHFRHSTAAGEKSGVEVARWVASRAFAR